MAASGSRLRSLSPGTKPTGCLRYSSIGLPNCYTRCLAHQKRKSSKFSRAPLMPMRPREGQPAFKKKIKRRVVAKKAPPERSDGASS